MIYTFSIRIIAREAGLNHDENLILGNSEFEKKDP
jgi:hypothetical protein